MLLDVLSFMNLVFTFFFLLETVLKLIAFGIKVCNQTTTTTNHYTKNTKQIFFLKNYLCLKVKSKMWKEKCVSKIGLKNKLFFVCLFIDRFVFLLLKSFVFVLFLAHSMYLRVRARRNLVKKFFFRLVNQPVKSQPESSN